ncbi:MAG: GntR family transcriptional regulator [Acidimicrobiales bacterium]
MTSTVLDRNDPLPLWAQLEADLRRRLEAGEFSERFPTDLELTEGYGVSRHTVREAVRQLNKTGLLRRERGRGTVVNQSEFEQSLGTLYSLYQSVESTGVEQASEVLSLEVVRDTVAAAHLELPDDTDLVFLERIRLAGGSPLAVDRAWLPHVMAEPLLHVDFTRTALYDELDRIGAPRPNQGWERLTPIVPSAADRQWLDLKKNEAAFFLERLGKRDDQPVEWRTSVVRGDRYRFVAEWSTGSRTQLRPIPH